MAEPLRLETWTPESQADLQQMLRDATATGKTVLVKAGGSCQGLGCTVQADLCLDLRHFSGLVALDTERGLVRAGAATPLTEITQSLRTSGWRLACSLPDFAPFYGQTPDRATLGGAVACALGGSDGVRVGPVARHVCGLVAVTGAGLGLASGSAAPADASGANLADASGANLRPGGDPLALLPGSLGTLAVMTALSVALRPSPQTEQTLLLPGEDETRALATLIHASALGPEVTGAAYLPAPIAACAPLAPLAEMGTALTLIRLEGEKERVHALASLLAKTLPDGLSPLTLLPPDESPSLWHAIESVAFFAAEEDVLSWDHAVVWRVALPPRHAPAFLAQLRAALDQIATVSSFVDRGGSLIWIGLPPLDDSGLTAIRNSLAHATHGQGEAILFRAPEGVRKALPVFPPLPAAEATLQAALKASFDPGGILNPGRLTPALSCVVEPGADVS